MPLVTPLQNENSPLALKPDEQYVPPRPFSDIQHFRPLTEFEQSTIRSTPLREQLQEQQLSAFVPGFQQHQASIKPNRDLIFEKQNIRSQNKLVNLHEIPATENSIPRQKSTDVQKVLRANNGNNLLDIAYTRRVIQRKRTQQRGDQGSKNPQNRPTSVYGVPTTVRNYSAETLKPVVWDRENTTRPARRRATTVRTIQVSKQ